MQNLDMKAGNGTLERYQIRWDGMELDISKEIESVRFLNKQRPKIDLDTIQGAGKTLHLLIKGRSMRVEHLLRTENGDLFFRFNGACYRLPMMNQRELLLAGIKGKQTDGRKQSTLKAPMPGLVLRVMVSEGQTLGPGDPILVLESMKMENVLRAQSACTVASITAKAIESVEKGQILVFFL